MLNELIEMSPMRFIYRSSSFREARKLIQRQARLLEEQVLNSAQVGLNKIQNGSWTGPDAEAYTQQIERSLIPKIHQLITALKSAQPAMERMDSVAQNAHLAMTKQIQELNRSFSLQYLNLQQKMQQENREFTMLSNVMKSKHDTARDAINNIR